MATDKIKKLERQLTELSSKSRKEETALRKIDILNNLACDYRNINPAKTIRYGKQALALAVRIRNQERISTSYQNIGCAYIAKCAYMKALEYLQKALKTATHIKDKSAIAHSCTNISSVHLRLGNYREALRYQIKAAVIFEKIVDKKNLGMCYGNIGVIYAEIDDANKALEYYNKSLKFNSEAKNNSGLTFCYIGAANVYQNSADYTKSLQYYLKALKIAEATGDKHNAASCYHNIGALHYLLGDDDKALAFFLKSVKKCKEINKKPKIALAEQSIGQIYAAQGAYDQAIKKYNKSLEIFDAIGDKKRAGMSHMLLGLAYLSKNGYPKALKHLQQSLRINETIGWQSGAADDHYYIARVYAGLTDYTGAIKHLRKGLMLAREIEHRSIELECLALLREMYEAKGDAAKALAYYKEYGTLKDDIFNTEKSRQIADMRTRYETEQKEKEAEIYRLRNVELRREIDKRKKAENELKQHRDQLETIVAKRTAKLKAINVELKQEIAERRRVEKELLGYQRQLRSLAHELSLVEEKQRRKIATNLHDNISQSLMIIKSTLDRLVTARSVKQVRHKLEEIQSYIMDIIQRTRSMTFEISPPVLYELGLEPAVEWLAERFQEQHGITCEFQDDGKKKPISEDWRCILFQSTRELLVNARKHANARKVVISTCKDGRHVKVIVKDDGVGFDPSILDEKIAKNEGFGLFNLRQRLTHLRGKVEIASEEGQGTKITISAPLTTNRRTTNRIQT